MSSSFGGTIKLQGENEYRTAVSNITSNLKVLSSNIKLVSSEFSSNSNSAEALTARNKVLAEAVAENQKKIDLASKTLAQYREQQTKANQIHSQTASELENEKQKLNQLKNSETATSEEITKQESVVKKLTSQYSKQETQLNSNQKSINKVTIDMNEAKTSANELNSQIGKNNTKLSELNSNLNRSDGELRTFGAENKNAGSHSLTFSDILKANLLSEAIKAGFRALVNNIRNVANQFKQSISDVSNYADTVDKSSQKMNISTKSYQEWSYALQQNGMDMSSMTPAFKKLTTNLAEAQNGSEGAIDTFGRLGISQQELAGMDTDQAFSRVISGLQGMSDTTQRTAVASELFGKKASQLGPLLNMSTDDTEALRKKAEELGLVMDDDSINAGAKFHDMLQTVKDQIGGLKNRIIGELMPGLNDMAGGFSKLLEGDTKGGLDEISKGIEQIANKIGEALPGVMDGLGQLVQNMVDYLMANMPQIIEAGMNIITSLTYGILQALPQMLDMAGQILNLLAQGLITALPTLIPTIVQVVITLVSMILENLPQIISVGAQILGALIQGIGNSLPLLAAAASQLVSTLWNIITTTDWISLGGQVLSWIVSGLGMLLGNLGAMAGQMAGQLWNTITSTNWLQLGISILSSIVSGISSILSNLGTIAGQMASQVVDTIASTDWLTLGKNILSGIGDGIVKGVKSLLGTVADACESLVDGVKDFFGIKSPSRLMRDEVGVYLAKGIGVGFVEEMENVNKTMQDALPTSFDTDVNLATQLSSQKNASALANQLEQLGLSRLTGTTINMSQTINSHDSLSPSEIANETQDTMSRLRWKLG